MTFDPRGGILAFYLEDSLNIVQEHGNKEEQCWITIIILETGTKFATAYSDNMMTKNGNTLEGKEGIIVNIKMLEDYVDMEDERGLVPPHEVVHLAGLQDAPTGNFDGRMTQADKDGLAEEIENKEIEKNGETMDDPDAFEEVAEELEEDYERKRLNSYNPKRQDTLSKGNEKVVKDYFKNKTEKRDCEE